MNSPSATASPKYKNLNYKNKQSPQEIKEKMRKNYKDKIHNCRGMLMDRLRGSLVEQDLSKTLTEIYNGMFEQDKLAETDELEILEEIKNELVQEEFEWCLQEYEKMENFDWSQAEQEDAVICPICQKFNINKDKDLTNISCNNCPYKIGTESTISEVKTSLSNNMERHSTQCPKEPQFTLITEFNDTHIYLICGSCSEMRFIV